MEVGPRLAVLLGMLLVFAFLLGAVLCSTLSRLVSGVVVYLTTARTNMNLNLNANTSDEMQAMLGRMASMGNPPRKEGSKNE
jgi:hypothetical protein